MKDDDLSALAECGRYLLEKFALHASVFLGTNIPVGVDVWMNLAAAIEHRSTVGPDYGGWEMRRYHLARMSHEIKARGPLAFRSEVDEVCSYLSACEVCLRKHDYFTAAWIAAVMTWRIAVITEISSFLVAPYSEQGREWSAAMYSLAAKFVTFHDEFHSLPYAVRKKNGL